jgi:L-rhamnose-H+ transport protein
MVECLSPQAEWNFSKVAREPPVDNEIARRCAKRGRLGSSAWKFDGGKMHPTTAGLSLLMMAGVMNASFSLPMKFTRKWAWENTWLVWSLFALILLPLLITYWTVPNLGSVYHQAGFGIVFSVAAFGAGWGIAQVLFGLALETIGIALTFSIVLGISAAMGSLIPLIRLHPEKIFAPGGYTILAGVLLVISGVAICAVAGRMREKASNANQVGSAGSFVRGLSIAITSGICAALMNFGVAFGGPLISAAAAHGAQPQWTVNAIWLPLMMAGAIPNIFYCIYLMRKNGTSVKFSEANTGMYWFLALVMACFWFGSTLMYGVSSGKLGELGAVLGWPLFMSLIVIVASVLGVITGEWKNTGRRPIQIQTLGVATLVVAVIVLSRASILI